MVKHLSSRERILDSAETIVRQQGALHMTMDAVAAMAGVSKGGLIYHFASQNALLTAMIQRFVERVAARKAEIYAGLPDDASRDIVAHVLLWSNMCETNRQVASALLAATMRAPALLQPAQAAYRQAMKTILDGQANRARMAILALAADGIWLMELLGMQPFTRVELDGVKAELVALGREWCGLEHSVPTQPESGEKLPYVKASAATKKPERMVQNSLQNGRNGARTSSRKGKRPVSHTGATLPVSSSGVLNETPDYKPKRMSKKELS